LSGDSKFRPKHLLKAVLKKDEAKELKMRMDTARNLLQLALISCSVYISFPTIGEKTLMCHIL